MLKLQQNFVRDNHIVFKVPVVMLEDVELNTQLSKLVSDLLCSIHGNMKAKVRKFSPLLCKPFVRYTHSADNINSQMIKHHGDCEIPCSSLWH
ncbi:hypothetical protein BDR04DRAFT_1039206 [Suillus decipiens]|nr:hypothetical protein BDR04DRAFT_1039206 [Suillus decipiens]